LYIYIYIHTTQPTTFDLFSGGPIHAHAAAAAPSLLQHRGIASLVAQQQQQQQSLVPTFSQQFPLFATAAGQHGANTTLAQQQAQAAFAVAFASAAAAAAAAAGGNVDPSSLLAQQQQALAAASSAPDVIPVGATLTKPHHPAPAAVTTAVSATNVAPLHHGQVPGQAQATVSPTFNGLAAAGTTGAQQTHPALVVGQQLAQQTEHLQMNPSLSSHHTLHQHHHHQHHPQAALVSTHGTQGTTTGLHAVAAFDPRMQLQQAFLNSFMQASMSFPNQLQAPHAAATAAASSQNIQEATAATQNIAPSGSQAHSILQSNSHHAISIPQQACHVNELPDFLSGIDNVALNSTTPNVVATTPLLHGSPPLTSSRSFDEFHRFLSDDLSLLEQTTKEAAAGVSPQEDTSKSAAKAPASQRGSQPFTSAVPDTMALFSADSYAMFAQESAMAASQHAAYLNDSVGSLTDGMRTTRKSPTFDIEGVVKLVSEHVPAAQTSRQVTTPPAAEEGNRAKNSPVNALDHLAEFYSIQQQQQQHHSRQQHHHRSQNPYLLQLASNQGSAMTMTQSLSAQSGQLLNLANGNSGSVPQVSGSELASSTETESSQPGSASESNASDSNNGSDSNNTEGNDDSEDGNPDSLYSSNDSDASGSYSDEAPCPKKTKRCQWQTRPRSGAHATNNDET
jgi:hypothetical protein